MNANIPNVINQYLQFAADLNSNVASAIQLLNHLRFNVSDIINRYAPLAAPPLPTRRPLNLPIIGLGGTLNERFGATSRVRRTPLQRAQFSTRSSQTNRVGGESTYRRTFSGARPTPTRVVRTSTTICPFSDLSTNYIMCPIRQTPFIASDNVMKINKCEHVFLEDALREWFRASSECPVCRHNINPRQGSARQGTARPAARRENRRVSSNIAASTEELRESLQYLMNFTDPSNNRILDSSGGTYGDTSAVLLEYSFPLTLT